MTAEFPNDFVRLHLAGRLAQQHARDDTQELERLQAVVSIAGRLISKTPAADLSLGTVQDASGRIEVLVSDEAAGKAAHAEFAHWQLGDIVGAAGILCRLPSGALALRAHELRRLVKVARVLPGSCAERTRRIADVRWRLLKRMRSLLSQAAYIEVETPLLHVTAAAAPRQFRTHHNALDCELYLRSSSDLHLERLLIGGMEKVYEVNRSFLNGERDALCEETAMEIYCAYANHSYMSALLEGVLTVATRETEGGWALSGEGGITALAAPFERITVSAAIARELGGRLDESALRDADKLRQLLAAGGEPPSHEDWPLLQLRLFEKLVAPQLVAPTFVTGFPVALCRRTRSEPADPLVAEHFKLYAGGWRIAEGGSVLNDPEAAEQPDFRLALEYGLPPCASVRMSIDRLTLTLIGGRAPTDSVLFPS